MNQCYGCVEHDRSYAILQAGLPFDPAFGWDSELIHIGLSFLLDPFVSSKAPFFRVSDILTQTHIS